MVFAFLFCIVVIVHVMALAARIVFVILFLWCLSKCSILINCSICWIKPYCLTLCAIDELYILPCWEMIWSFGRLVYSFWFYSLILCWIVPLLSILGFIFYVLMHFLDLIVSFYVHFYVFSFPVLDALKYLLYALLY